MFNRFRCFFSTTIVAISLNVLPYPAGSEIPADVLEAISETIEAYCESNVLVGASWLVVKDRRQVIQRTYGWSDREAKVPMDSETVFNIRSMTKMLTGAAIQILIDEGILRPEDHAAEYLPGFDRPSSRDITVKQLLTHRCGLPLSILTALDNYDNLISMGNAIGRRGPQFTPGSKFWYSDSGTDTLGAIIEVATGQSLVEFVRERLLDPLDMHDTYYPSEPGWPTQRVASLYYGGTGAWTRIWTPEEPFYPYAWGSQSLYSTPSDYMKFLAMLLDDGVANGNRILSMAAVRRILTPVSIMSSLGSDETFPTGFAGQQSRYGQMAVLYETEDGVVDSFGHSGSDGTWAWAWPDHDLMICFFTQSRGQATGIRLESDFDALLFGGRGEPDASMVEKYGRYCGLYQASFDSLLGSFNQQQFTVVIQNGRLGIDIPGFYIIGLKDPGRGGAWYLDLGNELHVRFETNEVGDVTGLRFYEPQKVFRLPRKSFGEEEARFLRVERLTGSGDTDFTTILSGAPGSQYRIERSPNLRNWNTWKTVLQPQFYLHIRDLNPERSDNQFYRALFLSN
ncbi:MAG TPA: class A beta-lactamase-related serine hydrolase [Verrucomicrobiales bacterium]|nr:class A beta-lactamase-related serine hydrolase [Verrucomicrobiales bacterium]